MNLNTQVKVLQYKILEEAYRILPTAISNMTYSNQGNENLAQYKYYINLSNADLEQVLECLTNKWVVPNC